MRQERVGIRAFLQPENIRRANIRVEMIAALAIGGSLGFAAASSHATPSSQVRAADTGPQQAINSPSPVTPTACRLQADRRQLLLAQADSNTTKASGASDQTASTPGSPSGTATIDGKYVPNPAAKFGGVINLNAKDSKPYWPPQIVPPKGAPNVLLIMT